MKRFVPALIVAVALAVAARGAPLAGTLGPERTTEANITRLTANILEHSQFGHHPLDSQLATKLLQRYLDALDGSRSVFLQTDVDEFAKLAPTLADATRAGDTSAAHSIFARYLQRLTQQSTYVDSALRAPAFDFTGKDVYTFDRRQSTRPPDLMAAQQLWRLQLRAEYLQEKLDHKAPAQIAAILNHRHQQQLRVMKGLGDDQVLELYLDALAHVYDPHSDYLGREQTESLSIAMNLSLFGIGATLDSREGYCNIRELVPGGPAARSGLLRPGDRIVAVAQAGKDPVDIMSLPLTRTVELIRGPKGSTVSLSVLPVGSPDGSLPRTVVLVRDKVNLQDQEAKARIVDLPSGGGAALRLGVIDLPSFYEGSGGKDGADHRSATADVARLLAKLKKENVRGIVLDLRHNGGGALDEAINLTGLFIRRGPVVQTRGPAGDIDVGVDDDPAVQYDGPLVLLTSRFSASASEILAGALKDYGRAVIVGDASTFGKGTVQSILPLARIMDKNGLAHAYDPGELKITIRKFYRPGGASTQLRGVLSDIVLPSTSDLDSIAESSLPDPLPWDSVPAASFERLNRVRPYVAALRANSASRVAAEPDFRYLKGEEARLKAIIERKFVSLNEAERRAELAETKAVQSARAQEDLAAHVAEPVSHDITLADASLPGLPAPAVSTKTADTLASGAAATGEDDPMDTPAERVRTDVIVLNESLKILADYVHAFDAGEGMNRPKNVDDDCGGRQRAHTGGADLACDRRLFTRADAVTRARSRGVQASPDDRRLPTPGRSGE